MSEQDDRNVYIKLDMLQRNLGKTESECGNSDQVIEAKQVARKILAEIQTLPKEKQGYALNQVQEANDAWVRKQPESPKLNIVTSAGTGALAEFQMTYAHKQQVSGYMVNSCQHPRIIYETFDLYKP